jgi:FkbM family methyltransferase
MSRIIFDVGANEGKHFIDEARSSGSIVYAFEPVPEVVSILLNELRKTPCPTFHVVSAAVSDEEVISCLNIAGWHEYGCSSLLEFSDNIESLYVKTHQVYVPTIRLDTFIRQMDIPKIDFLKIDAQGNDLRVLKSLGADVQKVFSGVVEVPNELFLYKNMHTKDETIQFLTDNDFRITKIENNWGNSSEQNIFFERY